MKKIIISIGLAALGMMMSCAQKDSSQTLKGEVYFSVAAEEEKELDKLIAEMTLEEKVGQMAQVTLDVLTEGKSEFESNEPLVLDEKMLEKAFNKYKVGSVLNTANNRARTPQKWNELISRIQEVALKATNVPVLYGVDAIHGTTYTAGATFFPQQIGLGATFNRQLAINTGEITAYETRACGIPWTFSPVLDLGRDARWARMWETFGEDVFLVQEMGKNIIAGYQGQDNQIGDANHLAACLKHYLGYSSFSGKDRTPAYIPENELRERYLPPFRAAVEQGATTVMVNSGIINGTPVHASESLITTLLKKELGFEGLVVTDWADIENLHNRDKVASSQKEAVKMAINAGVDMSMIPYNFDFCDYLVELVNEGEVPMSRIDDAVKRILRVKKALNLFETPVTKLEDYPKFGSAEFEQKAKDAVAESITLLKNKNDILPLKEGTKILVTGPNADNMRTLNGGWSYSWQGEKVHEFSGKYQTILDAVKAQFGENNVKYEAGVSYNFEGKYYEEKDIDIAAAKRAASSSDVILLCLGENTYTEKPGDLHDLYLSENQQKLAEAMAATGKPVILVLNEGRPRLISKFVDKMQAVVQMYLPGNFGGEVLTQILKGDVNPSGKLPYTYPKYPNTLITYDFKPSENQDKMSGMYDYESFLDIQWPFGHGLSYTDFAYSDLKLAKSEFKADETIEVSVKVTNSGKRDGKEAVLVFTRDHYASVTPDVSRLRAFEKIDLKAGESKVVNFSIPVKSLAFMNAESVPVVEAGDFSIGIGSEQLDFTVTETKVLAKANPVL
ncbi:glycoside hydrolase family 3 N-terminal domain-containing protein [Limibacter armeniacum]|uniref:glycoside hydrolase family 3 N-terminal domain-containing protein n=1 Tax=Limibacter armeniacum TaxID=466084 RepID=UPI002FE58645